MDVTESVCIDDLYGDKIDEVLDDIFDSSLNQLSVKSDMYFDWLMEIVSDAYEDGYNKGQREERQKVSESPKVELVPTEKDEEEEDEEEPFEFIGNPLKLRRDNIVDFLNARFPEGVQAFDTPNVVGDPIVEIYDFQGVIINYCEWWDYIDIIGITKEEYQYILDNTKSYLKCF